MQQAAASLNGATAVRGVPAAAYSAQPTLVPNPQSSQDETTRIQHAIAS